MSSTNSTQIVIIGAGIIGASIAYFLSLRSHSNITVLERETAGSGASGHSFAWVNAFGKDPRDYHTLNRRSLDMWYRMEHHLDADIGIHYGGEMRWENTKERASQLQRRIKQLQTWGYPCQLISHDEMLELEPRLNPGNVESASYSNADIHVETDKFISACLNSAQAFGTELHTESKVIDFEIQNNRIVSVKTENTEFPCDVVVLANGIHITELASLVNIHIPQQLSPGIVIKTTPCDTILTNVAVIHAPPKDVGYQHIHLRQISDGSLRIGQGTQEGINNDDSQEYADALLSRAKTYLPAIGDANAITTPVGYRPMPLDGFPIIGFTKSVPNMYVAVMHSGVTLAPLVGEMSTMEIMDDVCIDWFEPYRLERFL